MDALNGELGREQCRKAAGGASTVCRICKTESCACPISLLIYCCTPDLRCEESSLGAAKRCWCPFARRHGSSLSTWCAIIAPASPLSPLFTATPTPCSPNCCMSDVRAATEPRRDPPCSPTWQPNLLSRATCETDIHTTASPGLPAPVVDIFRPGSRPPRWVGMLCSPVQGLQE